MSALLDAPSRRSTVAFPYMRTVGVVQLFAAALAASAIAFGDVQGCVSDAVGGRASALLPGGAFLAILLVGSGVAMTLRLPRTSAVAPALSLAISFCMLAGAGWTTWLITDTSCAGRVFGSQRVSVVLLVAAGVAVLVTSSWLLSGRREFAPWHEARGVVLTALAAVMLAVVGVGAVMTSDAASVTRTVGTVVLPAAVAVALTGWLRRSPAIALVVPAVVQSVTCLLW